MSEHLLHTLHVIASVTGSSSSSSPGKRSRHGRLAGGTAVLLKQLHPLFFAQPLSAFAGSSVLLKELQDDKSRQLQLGVAIVVSALGARHEALCSRPMVQQMMVIMTIICSLQRC